MGAMWATASRRDAAAALLFSCAVLSRETTLLLALALAGVWIVNRVLHRENRFGAVVFAVPMAVYAAWQIVLAANWGITPLRSGAPALALPFLEFARFLAASSARRYHQQRLYFTESLFLAAVVLSVVMVWRRSRAPMEWRRGVARLPGPLRPSAAHHLVGGLRIPAHLCRSVPGQRCARDPVDAHGALVHAADGGRSLVLPGKGHHHHRMITKWLTGTAP